MCELQKIATRMDAQINLSRLREVAVIMALDHQARVATLTAALERLRPGAYLLGTGPSTVGIYPLSVEEVVLGRMATPGEEPVEKVIDYTVNDCLYLSPYEVSRVHAKVNRRLDGHEAIYELTDLGSTCGTFVNGEQIKSKAPGCVLRHGDVVSLGSQQISTYVFCIKSPEQQETSDDET